MADESDILYRLDSHDTTQRAGIIVAPELDARVDLKLKLLARHIGFGPAVGGDGPFVSPGTVIDDFVKGFEVAFRAGTNHKGQTPVFS
jgi:hypothetical protein